MGGGVVKEEKKLMDKRIVLQVRGQDGSELFFQVNRSSQLRKLMTAYCDRQCVEMNSIRFIFDGKRVREEQTPAESLSSNI